MLCGSRTAAQQYSHTRCDRVGIIPVLELDGSFAYVCSMQRRCTSDACGCCFADSDALEQLPVGERHAMPFTPEMATGSIYISATLQREIDYALAKGFGGKTIADSMKVKSRERYDIELLRYLEAGEIWWTSLVARCRDEVWNTLPDEQRRAWAAQRETYLQRRAAPNKLKPYPKFEELYGNITADVVLDAFKRSTARKYIAMCVDMQNTSVQRLSMDDTMWVAKLVRMGALTVASNQLGECVSLMFLQSHGIFAEKRRMLEELGERARARHEVVKVIATDDCPNNTKQYKEYLGTEHHVLDAMHGQRRPTSEANNFGYFYPYLCHEVTMGMFAHSSVDEELIDAMLANGTMKVKIGKYDLKGTGAESDKLTPAQIKELKTVRFNPASGKKEGGEYYKTWTIRKYFRKPEVIAQKLTNLKETMRLRESTRAKSNPKHKFTMNEQVNDALDRLAANAPHLYDVGDPYQPDGMRNNAPHYKAARGTNLTESINKLFSDIMRGGSYSLLLAVGILMSAMTMYNADRRRAAGYELDYVHYNRRLIEDINKISARVGGVAMYDGQQPRHRLRPMLPDSGARFVANVEFAAYEPHARLHERQRNRMRKKQPGSLSSKPSGSDAELSASDDEPPSMPSPSPTPNANPTEAARRSPRQHAARADPVPEHGALAPAPPQVPQLVVLQCSAAAAGSRRTSSKLAYKKAKTKAKAAKGITCSAACREHYSAHCRKHSGNKCPGRGFHHLATCPVKQEADRLRHI